MYNSNIIKITLLSFLGFVLNFVFPSIVMSQVKEEKKDTCSRYVDRPYGKKDFISNTAAISSVSGDKLNMPANSLSTTLSGRIAGLTTVFRSGEPGYDAATLYIRGLSTYGKNDVLIYVDGFQSSFEHLNSQEIESISILKDAAALVPFGMEGANGVVWVTTKRGYDGKLKVDLQSRYGHSKPVEKLSFLDSYGYAKMYNEAYSNDNGIWTPFYTDNELQFYKDGSSPVLYPNVNWYDEVLRESSPLYDLNLSFRGGNQYAKYAVFLGYQSTDMLYKKDNTLGSDLKKKGEYTKYNFRANADVTINKIFSVSAELGGAISDYITPIATSTEIWETLASYPPNIYPVRTPDGNWGGSAVYMDNPAGTLFATGRATTHERTIQTNIKLKQNLDMFVKGLSLTEAISFHDYYNGYYNKSKNYKRSQPYLNSQGEIDYLHFGENTLSYKMSDQVRDVERMLSFYLHADYQRTFGSQNIKAQIGVHQKGIDLDDGVSAYFKQNFFAQFSYDYSNKYFAEIGMSYSGSENFSKGNRFGFFPSVSGAWVISNESFMNNLSSINLLKLRASAGIVGNDIIGQRFLYQSYFGGNMSTAYILGMEAGRANNTLAEKIVGNKDITWEKSHKYNLGLDVTLFKKLNASIDVFYEKRNNIIGQRYASVPSVYGRILQYENIGKVSNKGTEVEVNFADKVNDFEYSLTGIFSYARNKIKYQDEVVRSEDYLYRTGRPISQPFGLEYVGFYDIDDFDSSGNLLEGISIPDKPVQPGDLKYKDQNGDGFVNDDDQIAIGYSNVPEIVYSLNAAFKYKGFDLDLFFQGAANRSVYLNGTPAWAFTNNSGVPKIAEGRWAYYPEQGIDTRSTANYPRLTLQSNENNFRRSTFWTKNGAFLRLKNVEFGYTLPASITRKVKIEYTRFFVGGSNLLNWDKLDDYDAESIGGYPLTKNIYVGINISL